MWLLLVCIILWACSALLNKQAAQISNPFTIQVIVGLITLLLLPIWYWQAAKNNQPAFNFQAWKYLLPSTILGSIAFVCYLSVLKTHSAAATTSIVSIYPALVLGFGWFLGTEEITWSRFIGIILISFGIIIVRN